MKYSKCLLIILFFSFLIKIYPQSLELSDVNKFRDYLPRFPNFFHVDIFHTNWDYYHLFRETISSSGNIYDVLDNFNIYETEHYAWLSKKQINELLNYDVPEVINTKYYYSIGLTNNGHKKITIMIFGALYINAQETVKFFKLILERGFYEDEGDLDESDIVAFEEILENGEMFLNIYNGIFDERDLYLIRNDMEFVENIIDIIPYIRDIIPYIRGG